MAASPELNKTSTVTKQFMVDYTTATFEPLTEHEVNGLDYRYVYGNDRLSVNITGVETSSGNLIENGNQIRLYYHMDYLGTANYLTSPVTGKVTSWTHYNEWGEITHNAVLKTGQRELDLVKRYATHDYDAVLGMYYAKARMYDAENRRFASVDPVKGRITEPMTLVQYLYVVDDPLRWVDPLGLTYLLYMKDLNGHVLAKKELKFTNYIDDNWVHVREVEELISQAPGYKARVGYDSSTKQASFSVDTGANSYDMTVDIKKMNVPFWGLGTPVESNKVYFNFYNCWGNDKVVVDLDSLGKKLGVRFEIVWEDDDWRFIGAGIQFEISVTMPAGFSGTIGGEAVFFSDMELEGNNYLKIPDLYFYNGFSTG